MTEPKGATYGSALLAAQIVIGEVVLGAENDAERRHKMRRVIDLHRADLSGRAGDAEPIEAISEFSASVSREDRLAFLVEVFFLEPFAPYRLRSTAKARHEGVRSVAAALREDHVTVGRIAAAARSAKRSHRTRVWGKAGLVGVGAAVALGLGGWLAAPVIGGAIGAGAGLAGAAATAHGLALLGGGALAAGGAGMAGGMWLVAGAAAALGGAAGGGGFALYQLGASQARGELLKLQVTFKVAVLGVQADIAKAQRIIGRLVEDAQQLKGQLEVERALNERNARRVTQLEATIEAIEETVAWMEREASDAA